MPFITFMYRIGNDKQIYYGKYVCDYISDDHNGLDKEIEYSLFNGLTQYNKQKNLPEINIKIYIGVLSFSHSNRIPTFSSDNEKMFFDFYYERYDFNDIKTFVNGEQVIFIQ